MPKSLILHFFTVGLFLIVFYKFYHFQEFIYSDDHSIHSSLVFNAPFNIYGSERIQLQLLAIHSVWHQNELLISSSTNENEKIVSFISDYNKNTLNTYNHMWKTLLYSDITLQHLSKKCISDVKSSNNIDTYNIVTYGKLLWLDNDHSKSFINMNKCPKLNTNKTDYYFSFTENGDKYNQNNNHDIIILGECDSGIQFKEITLSNIYIYYDQLLSLIYYLRFKHPTALLVWSAPIIEKKIIYEIKVLHEYLSNKLLIHDNAVMIVYPYMKGANSTLTANDIFSKLNKQIECFNSFQNSELMSLNILHNNNNKPNKISSLAKTISMEYYYRSRSHHNITKSKVLQPTCSLIINSRKYDEKCLPYPKRLYPILVSGLGSSGTHVLANNLRSQGVQIKHEMIDNDGAISWFYGYNDVYINSSYPHHSELQSGKHNNKYLLFSPRFKKVIHIIRCPMNQISSFTTHLSESYNFAKHSIMSTSDTVDANIVIDIFPNSTCNRGDSCNLHFAAYSWLHYNRHIYQYADATFHIEDISLIMKYICNYLTISQGHIKCINTNNEYHSSYSNNNYYYIDYIYRKVIIFLSNLFNTRSYAFSSIHHHKHPEYNISHINILNKKLAQEIVNENQKFYHYNDINCNL